MKKIFALTSIMLFAAAMLTTGCTKEKGNVFRLNVQEFTGADKTTIGSNNSTVWTTGDRLWINNVQATVSTSATSSTATLDDEVTAVGGMLYAFYPGRATDVSFSAENTAYTYTLPESYSYSVNELKSPMASRCAHTERILNFSNLCTMLKLEFVVIPSEVTITSESTAITGQFTATYNGSGWEVNTPAATSSNKTLTISNPNWASVMYVPLPYGTHKLTITGKTFTRAMTSEQTMVKSTLYPIKCAHAFSVSGSQKVFFSPGNFEYKNTSVYFERWILGVPSGGNNGKRYTQDGNDCARFAEIQWHRNQSNNRTFERRGFTTYSWPTTNGYWLDLFGWGTGNIPGYNLATAVRLIGNTEYENFTDWGTRYGDRLNANSHTTGNWYTMNQTQWSYLLNLTTNSARNGKSRIGSVNSIPGLIIAPDDFSGSLPASIDSITWINNYQTKGVVFLPSAGCMDYQPSEDWSWGYVSNRAGYWTSTEYNDRQAYFVKIPEGASGNPSITYEELNQSLTNDGNKPAKISVRLVQNAD